MATTKYIDVRLRTKKAETNADKLNGKMKGLGTTVDKTSNSFGVLSKVAAAVGTAIVTGQITRYADAYTSLQNQVRQTTKSTEELTQRTADLLALANRSRSGVVSTAEAYTQLTLATEALNLTDERRLRLTETIAKSFTIAGKTQAQAEESTRQLNQAFSSGVLRGQEYNTIIENAPEIFRALQKSTGKTAGELRKLADTGQISSSVLITALDEAASTIDTKFNNSTATMAQNIEVANNNLTEFIGSSTTVQNVMGGLGGAIVTASENISTIASGAIVLASVFAARLLPSMVAYSSSLISNTAAQLTNGTAATRTVNIYGTVAVAAASATVATNTLTLAARAATGAMALFGGPLGIALIAATALYTFGDSVTNLNRKVSTATPEMEAFAASIEKMSRGAKGASLANINNEMTELRVEASELQEKLDNIKVQNDGGLYDKSTIDAANYRLKIKEINDQLDLLSQKQGIIVGAPDLSGGTNRGNINDPQGDTPKPTGQSRYSINLAQETEALQIELALRQQVEQGYLSQRDADLSASYLIDESRRAVAFENELLKIGENQLLKDELQAQFDEAEILRKQAFESQLTGIQEEGADNRAQAEINANNRIVQSKANSQNALLGLISQFAGRSKKAALALLAVQKGLAIAQTLSGALAGSVKVFGELPYPAAVVASGQILAQGKITAGLIAATGLAQAGSITSGGGSVSTSSNIGGSASLNTGQQAGPPVTQQSTRVINITGLENFGPDDFIPMTKSQFEAYLSGDENASVAINQGQSNAQRIGAI